MFTWPVFFTTASGLSLGEEIVSIAGRPSKFSIIFRTLPNGGEDNHCAAFRTNRFEVPPDMFVIFFEEKKQRSDLCMSSIWQ